MSLEWTDLNLTEFSIKRWRWQVLCNLYQFLRCKRRKYRSRSIYTGEKIQTSLASVGTSGRRTFMSSTHLHTCTKSTCRKPSMYVSCTFSTWWEFESSHLVPSPQNIAHHLQRVSNDGVRGSKTSLADVILIDPSMIHILWWDTWRHPIPKQKYVYPGFVLTIPRY